MRDRGSAPIELVVGIALLVAPNAMAVLIVPGWVALSSGADTAAATAARIVATGDATAGSEVLARAAVLEIAGATETELEFCPDRGGTCIPLPRGGRILVRVRLKAPALELPLLGSIGARWVTSEAVMQVDPYRSLP